MAGQWNNVPVMTNLLVCTATDLESRLLVAAVHVLLDAPPLGRAVEVAGDGRSDVRGIGPLLAADEDAAQLAGPLAVARLTCGRM